MLERFEAWFGPEFGHNKALDLRCLREALRALGEPQARLPPTLHVAGTNGKGSTIAFMRAIAEAAGLRVHVFTKPHLFQLSERFLVAGAVAKEEVLIETGKRVAGLSRELSQFDAQVAAAMLLFSETSADLALIETGMGGRIDSTNILASPAASVITPIGIDHVDVLGSTLEDIAAHKAGILKRGAPAIAARQSPEAARVIESRAAEVGAPLLQCGVDWDAFASNGRLVVQTQNRLLDLPLPIMAGPHQIENAGLACAAMLAWRDLGEDAFAAGIASARWPGRLQPVTQGALIDCAPGSEVWVDGAHNVHAASALTRALADMNRLRPARTTLILGLRARKDWRSFISALAPAADEIISIDATEDGVAADALAAHAQARGIPASTAPSLLEALRRAGSGRVVICGSLALAARALANHKERG